MTIEMSRFFTGLSRQVLFWFLCIAMVPLCLASWLSYQTASEQLLKDAEKSLVDASILQTRIVRETFAELFLDLSSEAERESNSLLLRKLSEGMAKSGKTAAEFTGSFSWGMLVKQYADDLHNFQYNYSHYDVLLIDTSGNILYTNRGEGDLGQNLFNGELASTRLAATVRSSLETGKDSFSDLEYYPTSGDLAGFLISALLGEDGNKIGLLAVQLQGSTLEQLIGQNNRFGKTGRRYLVGSDMTLRTQGALGDKFPVLDRKIETVSISLWKEHLQHGDEADEDKEGAFVYSGPHGIQVLGVHTGLDIAGIKWCYVAEINEHEVLAGSQELARLTLVMILAMILVVFAIALPVTRRIVQPIVTISEALKKVGEGTLPKKLTIRARHELGDLARGFNTMVDKLKAANERNADNIWLNEGAKKLSDAMQGDQDLTELSQVIISYLCPYLNGQIGAFYITRDRSISLIGSYAFQTRKGLRNHFAFGEGIVGQSALEKQRLVLSDIPEDYLMVSSGLGETAPKNILVSPVLWNNQVIALLEFGCIEKFDELHLTLLDMVSSSIATAIQTAISRGETKELLEKTQVQAEELQVREEELTESNDMLEQQAMELKKSQTDLEIQNERLQTQQEELRVANEELEERAEDLKSSRGLLEKQNFSLGNAKQELERRSLELELSTKYKSEFLANMSHELRTPLNSLLILANIMAENKESNLTEQQVTYSKTIFDSGSELLTLINEILDLAKIESGKVNVDSENIMLEAFVADLHNQFSPLAEKKGLEFIIDTTGAPPHWCSDVQKVGQILKNFLSNAFKFTERGHVSLRVGQPTESIQINKTELHGGNVIAFTVSDTGIGIHQDKQGVIFEAFQQEDGTTSRKYGGTGLGLSISRELTRLLGGEIRVTSEIGKGTSFTLTIPEGQPTHTTNAERPSQSSPVPVQPLPVVNENPPVKDDRREFQPGDRSVLIIEDDRRFSAIVADSARDQGFKVLIAEEGRTGLHLADFYQPSGIILDIGLPDIDGWQVMDALKDNSRTRHIPVHFMSANERSLDAMKTGAIGFLAKPTSLDGIKTALSSITDIVERPVKKLLVVEDSQIQSESLIKLIGNGDVETVAVQTGAEALQIMAEEHFDCIVLDLSLPDMGGVEVLEAMRTSEQLQQIPVVVYTGSDLEPKERAILDRLAQSIIVKDARSPEMVLNDTTLFLHRLEANLPEKQREMIRMMHNSEELFAGRKVLLVDDDMRNIFSLSAVLQEKKMQMLTANNGIEALEQLKEHPDTAIVLMDIMMPEMDGYEATRKIREQEQFAELPVIALTAKAMKGDRALCIEAGASDYLAKPLSSEKLLSLMRVWLYR